jgi:hypothetical protein
LAPEESKLSSSSKFLWKTWRITIGSMVVGEAGAPPPPTAGSAAGWEEGRSREEKGEEVREGLLDSKEV